MKQASKTLISLNSKFSKAKNQRDFLENGIFGNDRLPKFAQTILDHQLDVTPKTLDTLQLNVGYTCNQSCTHCHVDAGPDRTEVMSRETMDACLQVLKTNQFRTLDITGGAPELNPNFKWLVEHARPYVEEIIIRSNLTIIESHTRFNDLPDLFKKYGVRVICSLPCYTESNTDAQRGDGVFQASISALKRLNKIGYGVDPELRLDLVYNPGGAFLPPAQEKLESDYKSRLKTDFGIDFHELLSLNNLPISRFLDTLIREKKYERYMELLVNSFNSSTIDGLMCRNTLSVDWDGRLYDCDFNQMLVMPINGMESAHIANFDLNQWQFRTIRLSQHCYGCTAGTGSSCQGRII